MHCLRLNQELNGGAIQKTGEVPLLLHIAAFSALLLLGFSFFLLLPLLGGRGLAARHVLAARLWLWPIAVVSGFPLLGHLGTCQQQRLLLALWHHWRFTTADARMKLKRLYPSLEKRSLPLQRSLLQRKLDSAVYLGLFCGLRCKSLGDEAHTHPR
jgi:hypothetical protein